MKSLQTRHQPTSHNEEVLDVNKSCSISGKRTGYKRLVSLRILNLPLMLASAYQKQVNNILGTEEDYTNE